MSAALVASLLTFVAASSALAAITVTSAGNVPTGGTSATNVSFQFKEQAIASLANAGGTFAVTILDSASANTVSFVGTPSTAGSTGSLGATASIAGNVLTVKILASDTANIESIFVTGLKIKATSGAALGAIKAAISWVAGTAFVPATDAGVAAAFSGGGTASGTIVGGIGIGATSVVVNVTTPSCLFSPLVLDTPVGSLVFATSAETKALHLASALGTPAAGQQTLTIDATVNVHGANEVVTEATACAASTTLASPGTVVAAITYTSAGNSTVFPGENNSSARDLSLLEPSIGFLAASSTFTFKILTAGVVFSTAPSVIDNNAGMTLAAPVISADRLSATVTVSTASTVAPALITLQGIKYDVAATVPAGTFISVGLTTSAAQAVLPPDNTNAVVFRGISASAPSPTVYIGENNQTAGLITFKESAAGFFTAGLGTATNTFSICPSGVNFRFTTSPVASVVGGVAAGNLILRDGAAASATNVVVGTSTGSLGCYIWTVWTASTTATTINIGAAPSAATGPLINVSVAQAPGGVSVNLNIGTDSFDQALAATVQFATAVYRNQVAVTALSQPSILPGALNTAAGNLQIAETGLGQLKAGEDICIEVLYRSFVNPDVFMNSRLTADLPVVTSSGTGLVIGPVNASDKSCSSIDNAGVPNGYMQSFTFEVLQQSTAGDGKLVISNLRYTALTDAVEGPVQVSVQGSGGSPTSVIFHSTVSNARISSNTIAGTATTRLGVTQVGAFTTSTKVAKVKKYVTYRFDFGVAAAGQTVKVWGATKSGNDWSAFTAVTSRVANASGVVYYSVRQIAPSWKSYRANWTGGNVWTPARQARWVK